MAFLWGSAAASQCKLSRHYSSATDLLVKSLSFSYQLGLVFFLNPSST